MVNLYEILGVDSNANDKEIKRAFRVMAKKYHPDVSKEPNAQEKFNEIYGAYEILGDVDKRSYFDELLHEPQYEKSASSFRSGYDYDESYIYEWQEEAFSSANEYSHMTFKDFRDQQILMHQWSLSPVFEHLVNGIILGILTIGILAISAAFPYEGTDVELTTKQMYLGFGILVTTICSALAINAIRILIHNIIIKKELEYL
ncbi:MAG: DnaJ domain-containing protein [Bacteroidia bacterium]